MAKAAVRSDARSPFGSSSPGQTILHISEAAADVLLTSSHLSIGSHDLRDVVSFKTRVQLWSQSGASELKNSILIAADTSACNRVMYMRCERRKGSPEMGNLRERTKCNQTAVGNHPRDKTSEDNMLTTLRPRSSQSVDLGTFGKSMALHHHLRSVWRVQTLLPCCHTFFASPRQI
eukprot:COSAG01_NODE_18518_length_1070_cov_32.857998_2_plen_176_part_00